MPHKKQLNAKFTGIQLAFADIINYLCHILKILAMKAMFLRIMRTGILITLILLTMKMEANNLASQEIVIDNDYVVGTVRSFGDNTVVIIERGGHLIINADATFGKNCRIDSRRGKITVNAGNKMTLGENTLLMLSDYPMDGGGKLRGDFARVDAPVTQVFGSGLTVDGNWSVDRAYPHWFAAPGIDDWSEPINDAINFMRCGEVFLPRGLYPVKKTIYVKTGVRLTGASGHAVGGYIGKEKVDSAIDYCSVIQACYDNEFVGDGGTKKFMILVNAKSVTDTIDWVSKYPTQGTIVQDIGVSVDPQLYKYYDSDDKNTYIRPENVCGIFFSGAAEFRNVMFFQCRQAIVSDDDAYSDLKKVVDCAYYGKNEDNSNYDDWVFDLSGLGDGLVFEHNIVGSRSKALKLHKCMSAKVCANILTGVYFKDCRGVVFESNHMESDPQVEIEKSTVAVKNNYMEVGNRPSIFIHSAGDSYEYDRSVVEIGGNFHNFVDGDRDLENHGGTLENRLEGVCEYDICIDRNSIVQIDNEYRYRTYVDLPHPSYPHGIKINVQIYDEDNKVKGHEPFEKFNNHSHLFSEKCNIRPDLVIMDSTDEPETAGGIYYLDANGWAKWAYGEDGNRYTYSYQFCKDGKPVGSPISCMSASKPYFTPTKAGRDYVCGAMLFVWGMDETGKYAMVRLTRKNIGTGETLHVDIPFTGSRNLWDNGVSVAGFKWTPEKESTNE